VGQALRQGELQDYLREACETTLQKQDVGQINSPNTAIVYIIPLADRTERISDAGLHDALLVCIRRPRSGRNAMSLRCPRDNRIAKP